MTVLYSCEFNEMGVRALISEFNVSVINELGRAIEGHISKHA